MPHPSPPRRHSDLSRTLRALKMTRRALRADHVTVSRSAIGDDAGDHTMVLPFRFGVPIYGHTHVGEGTEKALTPQATNTRRWTTPMHTIDRKSTRRNSSH